MRLLRRASAHRRAARSASADRDIVAMSAGRAARDPRRRDRDGLPGPDDLAQSGAAHRAPAGRDDGRARPATTDRQALRRGRSTCWAAWASPRPNARSTAIRTSSPAACASASCWRWVSPTSRSLLIADEPTTALDVTIQAQILDLLRELNRDFGTAIVLISHDLGVIANVCSARRRDVRRRGGRGGHDRSASSADPRHPYTWALINAVPRLDRDTPGDSALMTIEGTPPDPLALAHRLPLRAALPVPHRASAPSIPSCCRVGDPAQRAAGSRRSGRTAAAPLDAHAVHAPDAMTARGRGCGHAAEHRSLEIARPGQAFPAAQGDASSASRVVHAVDGVDLDVVSRRDRRAGRRVRLRQVDARAFDRAHPRADRGLDALRGPDIAIATPAQIRPLRRRMQMIFQDPYASLNPRMTVAQIPRRAAALSRPRGRRSGDAQARRRAARRWWA